MGERQSSLQQHCCTCISIICTNVQIIPEGNLLIDSPVLLINSLILTRIASDVYSLLFLA
jgi:hypothetical protein